MSDILGRDRVMTAWTVLSNIVLEIGFRDAIERFDVRNRTLRSLLALMNVTGKDIARRVEWSRLTREMDVAEGSEETLLPDDFHRMSEGGVVYLNKEGFHPVRLVAAPEQWAFLKRRPSSQSYCHLSGGRIQFAPKLGQGGARMRYVSKYWAQGQDKKGKDAIDSGEDTLLIPERLVEKGSVWRWRRQKGLPYDDVFSEFEADLATETRADRGAS